MPRLLLILVILSSLTPSGVAAPARRGDVGSEALRRQMLDAHNAWRSKYRVPPLVWSSRLARHAQQWAGTLIQRRAFEHSSDSPYGENLAVAMGQRLTPQRVVAMWGSESKDYDRRTNSCRSGEVCGHFTQLVWRATKEVGCGVARDAGREVWVCNYSPPGNVIGRAPW